MAGWAAGPNNALPLPLAAGMEGVLSAGFLYLHSQCKDTILPRPCVLQEAGRFSMPNDLGWGPSHQEGWATVPEEVCSEHIHTGQAELMKGEAGTVHAILFIRLGVDTPASSVDVFMHL